MRVLVVDDEPIARRTIAHILQHDGFEVLSATNGPQALDLLQRHACQLVVTDWSMPGMSGAELCRAIRAAGLHAPVYVLMVTARDLSEEPPFGGGTEADAYLTKPFSPLELLACVKQGLAQLENHV